MQEQLIATTIFCYIMLTENDLVDTFCEFAALRQLHADCRKEKTLRHF